VPLKLRLSEAEVARFAVQRYRFPGVDVVPYLNRRYPYGDLFAHVVGYVGRIDATTWRRSIRWPTAAPPTSARAASNAIYESRLHGEVGFEQVEINAEGRSLRVLERQPARVRRASDAEHRCRPAAGDGGCLRRASTAWRWRSIRAMAKCWHGEPAELRPQSLRQRHRPGLRRC
jgi:hypothetical protein